MTHSEGIQIPPVQVLKNLICEAWDSKSVVKAHGFLVFLEDFESVFLLAVFSDAFSYTYLLFRFTNQRF